MVIYGRWLVDKILSKKKNLSKRIVSKRKKWHEKEKKEQKRFRYMSEAGWHDVNPEWNNKIQSIVSIESETSWNSKHLASTKNTTPKKQKTQIL